MPRYSNRRYRLNLEDPEERKIAKILDDLNPNLFKSSNTYVVAALKHYATWNAGSDITQESLEKNQKNNSFITRGEFEQYKKTIEVSMQKEIEKAKEQIEQEINRNVIEILLSGLKGPSFESIPPRTTEVKETDCRVKPNQEEIEPDAKMLSFLKTCVEGDD